MVVQLCTGSSMKKRIVCMASRPVDDQFFVSSTQTMSEDVSQEHFIHAEHGLVVRRNRLTSDQATRAAALFAVFSDPTPIQVVYALPNAPTGALRVGALATGLGPDDTTISHQLRLFRTQQALQIRH